MWNGRATRWRRKAPLTARLVDGQLVVSVGIETIKLAFEHHPEWDNPDAVPSAVTNPDEFAHDVILEMNDESENGSTPLTRFLDDMLMRAMNNGSMALDHPE